MLVFMLSFLLTSIASAGEVLPDWFIPLREAVYEQQLTAEEIVPLYREISNRADTSFLSDERLIMLSRCEFLMGKAYLNEEKKKEAGEHFEEGMRFAERALQIRESAEAWVMRAENLSQNCVVRSVAYVMSNGLNVEKFAKYALDLDSRNAAAQFMIAARWVYAPAPFSNHRRGIDMLYAIQTEGDMQKDDMFNVYSSIGYGYLQRKDKSQARYWLLKSLEVYPTNKFVQSLLAEL